MSLMKEFDTEAARQVKVADITAELEQLPEQLKAATGDETGVITQRLAAIHIELEQLQGTSNNSLNYKI